MRENWITKETILNFCLKIVLQVEPLINLAINAKKYAAVNPKSFFQTALIIPCYLHIR